MRCFSNLSCHFGSYSHSQMRSLAPRQERICVFTSPRTLSYIIYRYQFSLCEGSTIELLDNIDGEYTIEKACTIVTNGKTITVKAGTDFNMAFADNTYTFTAKVYVAQVGGTKYESFAEAYAKGTEITLLANVGDVTISKACVINAGKYTINITIGDNKYYCMVSGTTHTIKLKNTGIYLRGSFNNNTDWANGFEFEPVGENMYVARNITVKSTDEMKFFIKANSSWLGGNGSTVGWRPFYDDNFKLGANTYDIYISKNGAWNAVVAGTATPDFTTRYLYLNAGAWNDDSSAWFQAWCWNGGNGVADAWTTFTHLKDDWYYADIKTYTSCRLLRKGPDHASNSWDKWNESGDINLGANLVATFNSWSTFTLSKLIP